MVWKFKKIIILVLAGIFGSGIIFLAVYKSYFPKNTNANASSDTTDTSWKDALSVIPATSPETLLLGKQATLNGSSTEFTLPPTTTNILARELLREYATTQGTTGEAVMSDADARAAALRMVEKTKLPAGKQYRARDLIISTNNDSASIDAYVADIKTAMLAFATSATKSDIEIVYTPPGTDDAKKKLEYTRMIARYEKLIKSLLATKTPSSMVSLHVRMVQAYSNMENSLKIMMEIFADPVKGLAALSQYRVEIANLIALSKEYEQILAKDQ